MDGGVGSTVNLALADDCEVAVALIPQGISSPSPFGTGTRDEVAARNAFAVFADDEALAAFGANPLDPACRIPSAHAGRRQGRRVVAQVAAYLEL